MFDWNHNGKQDTSDSFMEFMIFNSVMNDSKKQADPKRDWIDELEELDAIDDEDG